MSYLWAGDKTKCHLWMILTLLIWGQLLVVPALASQIEASNFEVSREAIFTRAYKSLGFVIMMATQDKVFVENMTTQERMLLNLVLPLINEITTLNWLEENHVEKKLRDGNQYYAYVAKDNQPITIAADANTHVKLNFSNDVSLFDLKDGKPPRDAVTGFTMQDDIHINLNKINHPNNKPTLGLAFSILLHEFGNKLLKQNQKHVNMEDSQIQATLDSLGGKLEAFVNSRISKIEVRGATFHVLKFQNAPFDHWVEGIIYGHFRGVNIPPQFVPFIAFDMQGTYVLLETPYGYTDLTEMLLRPESSRPFVPVNEEAHYKWGRLNWFLSNFFEIRASGSTTATLEFNLNQLQMVLPFWQQGAYDPKTFQLYQRSFKAPPHNAVFYNNTWEIDYSAKDVKILKKYATPMKFEIPFYQVERLKGQWKNQDLILTYKILGDRKFSFTPNHTVELWPEVVLEFNGERFEVKASRFDSNTGTFEFHIPNIKKANQGMLRIVGLEFTSREKNLAHSNSDLRVRTFLPSIEEVELIGEVKKSQTILKSIQVWNGQKWMPLTAERTVSDSLTGSHVRFIFQANEKLRSLSILQHLEMQYQLFTDLFPGTNQAQASVGPLVTQPKTNWITIQAHDMRQELNINTLIVEIDLDQNFAKEMIYKIPLNLPDSDELPQRHIPKILAVENARTWIDGLRGLDVIRTVTDSLNINTVQLQKVLTYKKVDDLPLPPIPQCHRLFKGQ